MTRRNGGNGLSTSDDGSWPTAKFYHHPTEKSIRKFIYRNSPKPRDDVAVFGLLLDYRAEDGPFMMNDGQVVPHHHTMLATSFVMKKLRMGKKAWHASRDRLLQWGVIIEGDNNDERRKHRKGLLYRVNEDWDESCINEDGVYIFPGQVGNAPPSSRESGFSVEEIDLGDTEEIDLSSEEEDVPSGPMVVDWTEDDKLAIMPYDPNVHEDAVQCDCGWYSTPRAAMGYGDRLCWVCQFMGYVSNVGPRNSYEIRYPRQSEYTAGIWKQKWVDNVRYYILDMGWKPIRR